MKICAAIPAYNSETTIGRVVANTLRQVDRVVVINDGSTDRTARKALKAGAHVIGSLKNQGKGLALSLGFKYALSHDFDAVITLDADLQHDPSDIPRFVEHHRRTGAMLVIGDRMHAATEIPRYRYLPNRIGTRCFTWLTGQPILDSQCGFRLYTRELLKALPVLESGFEAESDLLLRAGKCGYKIEFVQVLPVYHSPNGSRGRSFYRPVKDTYLICINFLKNWFWQKR